MTAKSIAYPQQVGVGYNGCPPGYIRSGNHCYPMNPLTYGVAGSCPPGYTFRGGRCVPMNMQALSGVGVGAAFAQDTVDKAIALFQAAQAGCPVDTAIVTAFQTAYKNDPNAGTFPAVTGVYDGDTQVALADATGRLTVNTTGGADLVDSSVPAACIAPVPTFNPALPPGTVTPLVIPASATSSNASSTTVLVLGGLALVAAVGAFMFVAKGRGLQSASAPSRAPRRSARRSRRRR